jgi:hypothetical protein
MVQAFDREVLSYCTKRFDIYGGHIEVTDRCKGDLSHENCVYVRN